MIDTETYLKVLDPEDTSTGGGSASAIAGAMAGALIAMVCNICARDQGIDDRESFQQATFQAKQLSEWLLAGARDDTRAFQAVRSAYKLSKESDEERKTRSQAIQAAWIDAARAPLENAVHCLRLAELGLQLERRVLSQVHSDLSCARLLAHAGALGCLENVAINLPQIKDQTISAQLAEQAAELRFRIDALN